MLQMMKGMGAEAKEEPSFLGDMGSIAANAFTPYMLWKNWQRAKGWWGGEGAKTPGGAEDNTPQGMMRKMLSHRMSRFEEAAKRREKEQHWADLEGMEGGERLVQIEKLTDARQRIAEGVEVIEQGKRAEHGLHRAQQRRHEQAGDAAVEPLGHPAVVALGKLVVQVGIGQRIAQAREELAGIVPDVAVVHGDHARDVGGEHVAIGQPGAPPLAGPARIEPLLAQPPVEPLHPRPAVPQHDRRLAVQGADPIEEGPAYKLYTREFYNTVAGRLTDDGLIAVQAGSASLNELLNLTAVNSTLQSVFPIVTPYNTDVPCFGGPWGFCIASGKHDPGRLTADEINRRISLRSLKALKLYDGITHRGMFSLPLYLRNALESQPRIITDADPLYLYSG